MTDNEVDADIERMLAQHHARKTLGWSYFQSNPARVAAQISDASRRRANAERQAKWRARQ